MRAMMTSTENDGTSHKNKQRSGTIFKRITTVYETTEFHMRRYKPVRLSLKRTVELISVSLLCLCPSFDFIQPNFSRNGGTPQLLFVEGFVTTPKDLRSIPLFQKGRVIATYRVGECQHIGSTGRLCPELATRETTLFSDVNHLNSSQKKRSRSTRKNMNRKQKQRKQENQLIQPLSQSRQDELFKIYYEYKRIQSTVESETNTSLQEQAKLCGYSTSNFTQFENILSEGPDARETLFIHNVPLVHYVVNSLLCLPNLNDALESPYLRNGQKTNTFMTTHLSKDDLLQEGIIGLSRAIDKFNPYLNFAFSTYASHWIKAGVRRCIYNGDELIRVPEHVSTAVRKLNKAIISGQSSPMDFKTLAEKTGLTANMVREATVVKERRQWSKRSGGYVALEDWMVSKQNENNPKLHYDEIEPEREGVIQQVKETIRPFLSLKEMQALSWRYGLQREERSEFRDYESEAEEDLFGPAGIISSDVVNKQTRDSTVDEATDINSTVRNLSAVNYKTRKTTKRRKITIKDSTKGGRWGEAMSFAEVAEQMRISGSYGRRLCSSAMKKLIQAAEDGRLDPALFY